MRITIITVCFNAAKTVQDTIESVSNQTYQNVEYIVVDGGSNDETPDILKDNEHRIDQYISETDDGLYDAMNKGLAMASGDVIGFLNADDCLASPASIQLIADCFTESGGDAVLGDVVLVKEDDLSHVTRFYPAQGFKSWQFRVGHAPPHPGAYIKTQLMRSLGGFNIDYPLCADFDLLLRLFQQTPRIGFVKRTIVKMREGGLSTRGISATRKMNDEKKSSCNAIGLPTSTALMWLKYGFKVFQYVRRPIK